MSQKILTKWYGWRPELPDHRDHKFSIPTPKELPPQVDLTGEFPDVYDQGNLGSCTANGIAGLLQYDEIKQQEPDATTPSRLFIYYNERVIEGTVGQDSGAYIRDGIKSVKDKGAPPEKLWPYVISKFRKKPSRKSYKEALKHQSLEYQRIDNTQLDQLKTCLAAGFPFTFGFTVYDYFESSAFAKDWILPVPGKDEQVLGGHCVVAVGYNDDKGLFLVRNSWGKDWGFSGYYFQAYDYLTNTDLADDFWMITKVE